MTDPIYGLTDEQVAGLVAGWADHAAPQLSRHIRIEVAVARWRGRPLDPGVPVPGCGCRTCTGIPADAPARRRKRSKRDLRPAIHLDRARAVPIADVARRLGLKANRHGWALCPFHDDSSPSFHLNAKKNRAFCNPCGRSWDGIALMMELGKMTFADAAKELAA